MALHDVLDDRQAEPGSPRLARTPAINSIEALGQARQVDARDPGTVVDDGDLATPVVGA